MDPSPRHDRLPQSLDVPKLPLINSDLSKRPFLEPPQKQQRRDSKHTRFNSDSVDDWSDSRCSMSQPYPPQQHDAEKKQDTWARKLGRILGIALDAFTPPKTENNLQFARQTGRRKHALTGCISINLVLWIILVMSPNWYTLAPRTNIFPAEYKLVSPLWWWVFIRDPKSELGGLSFLTGISILEAEHIYRYSLADHRDNICAFADPDSSIDDACENQLNDKEKAGFAQECVQLKKVDQFLIVEGAEARQYPLPLPSLPRPSGTPVLEFSTWNASDSWLGLNLFNKRTRQELPATPTEFILPYQQAQRIPSHCAQRPESSTCPIGYEREGNRIADRFNCHRGFARYSCVVNMTEHGPTLCPVGVSECQMYSNISYVQVYGRSKWDLSDDAGKRNGTRWIRPAKKRCNIYTKLAHFGNNCLIGFVISALFMLVAWFLILTSSQSHWKVWACGFALCGAFIAMLATMLTYTNWIESYFRDITTPFDDAGRPYYHAMCIAADWRESQPEHIPNPNFGCAKDQDLSKRMREEIIGSKHDQLAWNEWSWSRLLAYTDIGNKSIMYPDGFERMAAWYLVWFAIAMCAIQILMAVDTYIFLRYEANLFEKLQAFMGIFFCCFPFGVKKFVDVWVAPYDVLGVYPWQRTYKYFSTGTVARVTRLPFDACEFVWDCIILHPLHWLRAMLDFPVQDIASETEKAYLRKYGTQHDRCWAVLASRRSYLIVMVVLGWVVIPSQSAIIIQELLASYSYDQSTQHDNSYLNFYCAMHDGDCDYQRARSDYVAFAHYISACFSKMFASVQTQIKTMDVSKDSAQLVSKTLSLAFGMTALRSWKNFGLSAKYCILSWFFYHLSPVVTSLIVVRNWISLSDVRIVADDLSREVLAMISSDEIIGKDMCSVVSEQQFTKAVETAQWACGYLQGWFYYGLLEWIFRREDNSQTYEIIEKSRQACFHFLGDQEHGSMGTIQKIIAWWYNVCSEFSNMAAGGNAVTNSGAYAQQQIHVAKEAAFHFLRTDLPEIIGGLVGLRAALLNFKALFFPVLSMVPALLQGCLMMKNVMPQNTLGTLFVILPFAYVPLQWAQYQVVAQVVGDAVLTWGLILMSFSNLLYYFFGRYYKIAQPMDDQQSVTYTFRVWYYALVSTFIVPYAVLLCWVLFGTWAYRDVVYDKSIGWFFTQASAAEILDTIAGTVLCYVLTIQAAMDWFTMEACEQHRMAHAPWAVALGKTKEESEEYQQLLGSTIDLSLIDDGRYVCGGLQDIDRVPHDVLRTITTWEEKAKTYAISLYHKHLDTCDAFCMIDADHGEYPSLFMESHRKELLTTLRAARHAALEADEDLDRVAPLAFRGNCESVMPCFRWTDHEPGVHGPSELSTSRSSSDGGNGIELENWDAVSDRGVEPSADMRLQGTTHTRRREHAPRGDTERRVSTGATSQSRHHGSETTQQLQRHYRDPTRQPSDHAERMREKDQSSDRFRESILVTSPRESRGATRHVTIDPSAADGDTRRLPLLCHVESDEPSLSS